MDDWDRAFYHDYFVNKHGRNPTIVEIMDLNNANSEHSRHGFFRGRQVIDGAPLPETLMEIVKSTLAANPANSIIAFKDNSSGIAGRDIETIFPAEPGGPSPLVSQRARYHVIFTAETHNFPTGVAPFPGAETGTGGRIRDVQGTGRGGFVVAGTAAYCVANLHIPGYEQPWETPDLEYPGNLARALAIEIEASNGASDYGNKFGEPLIQGFTRSFDMVLPGGRALGLPEADHVRRRHRPDRRPAHREGRARARDAHPAGRRAGLPRRLRRRGGLVACCRGRTSRSWTSTRCSAATPRWSRR